MRVSPVESIDMPRGLEKRCKRRHIERPQVTNRNYSNQSLIRPTCTKSIDRYLRAIEQSPVLWLNLNIEFETKRVARSRDATTTFE